MSGRRLWLTIAGVLVLAVLAVVAVVAGNGSDDDDTAGGTTTTSSAAATTGGTEPVTTPPDDRAIAATLLPPVSALGPNWIETGRDDEPSEATIEAGDACPSGPIPEGWLIRSEQRRTAGTGATDETLSVTAGVVAEGAEPADLEDPAIVSCLLDGMRSQLPATSTVEAVEGPLIGATPPGALVSHQRFVVTGTDGTGGTFDFLVVRRSRAVSLGLLTAPAQDPNPTELGDVVAVLDAPLQAALPDLD